jgi:hypothetical protein
MSPHDVTVLVGWHYDLPEHLVLDQPMARTMSKWPEKEQATRIVHFANDLAYNLFSWPYPEILEEFAPLLSETTQGLELSAETLQISLAVEYQQALRLGAAVNLDSNCFTFQKTMPEGSERNNFLGLCQNAQRAQV